MTTATTTLTEASDHPSRQRSFLYELLSLIAKVFATAIAINLVFAAIILLFASQASADTPQAKTETAMTSLHSEPSPAAAVPR